MKRLDGNGDETGDSAKYSYGGKELDSGTNLYYFNARYYDATIGRFINVDPVQDGGNWYVYVRNNPLRRIDITGLNDDDIQLGESKLSEDTYLSHLKTGYQDAPNLLGVNPHHNILDKVNTEMVYDNISPTVALNYMIGMEGGSNDKMQEKLLAVFEIMTEKLPASDEISILSNLLKLAEPDNQSNLSPKENMANLIGTMLLQNEDLSLQGSEFALILKTIYHQEQAWNAGVFTREETFYFIVDKQNPDNFANITQQKGFFDSDNKIKSGGYLDKLMNIQGGN